MNLRRHFVFQRDKSRGFSGKRRWAMRKKMTELLRNRSWAIFLGLVFFVTAGCGGGGGSGPSASAGKVNVSLTSVPPPLTTTLLHGTTAEDPLAKPAPPGDIDHAWITIFRIGLLPGENGSDPDSSGEPSVQDSGNSSSGIVARDIPPTEVDLLNLPRDQAALFLNAIDNVPAGTYGKIRLFYTDPKVHFEGSPDNSAVHPTANYHLDIHFKGGDLVIPVATGREGGVIVHDVTIVFVLGKDGLKIKVNPNKILMRPQVFATVGTVQFVVSGVADNVDKILGTFDIATSGGRVFHTEYDTDTDWFFRDSGRNVSVDGSLGIPALRDTAIVDVLGKFPTPEILRADDILITFPLTISDNVVSGDAVSGWNTDNTFTLETSLDNVVPRPDRFTALYDNAVSPFGLLDESFVVKGAFATTRGYPALDGIEAYWISLGP
jgi:hypothetical protein